jgi:hypothetical protein
MLVGRIAGRYLLAVAQACLTGAMLWAIRIAQPWQALVYDGILGFTSGLGAAAGSIVSGVVCTLARVVARSEWAAIRARLRPGASTEPGVPAAGARAIATRQDAGFSRE